MTLITKFIGKSIKRSSDDLLNGKIIAAVEIGEATDKTKALDSIRRTISSSTSANGIIIIAVKL